MKKKILSAILCATTIFSAVGFSACEVTDVLFADYKGQIAEMQETLNAQQEKITDFESDVKELQEAINEKEEQIAGLQGLINEQQEQIAQLEQEKQVLEENLEKHNEPIVEQKVNGMIDFYGWYLEESEQPHQIEFYFPMEDVLFECISDNDYGGENQEAYECTVSAKQFFVWGYDYARPTEQNSYKSYIDVYVKLENNYVGYAVIELNITRHEDIPTVLKSVMFPKIGGKYQQISKEEVKYLMDKVKKAGGDGVQDGDNDKGNVNYDMVQGGYIKVLNTSAIMAYRVQKVVPTNEEYIPFEIAMSDTIFSVFTNIKFLSCVVTITVENWANASEKVTLETIDGNNFNSTNYGHEKVKDENGDSVIKYHNYVKYNVPTSLLTGESGFLCFRMSESYSDYSVNATTVVGYEYKNGRFYFTAYTN